ncbi:hypothetical protein AB0D67_37655 [Streptosporangium sp. NPDC048047]|uniref:hypothetical protein n=1 Tax=Streptosporangium sp. NPDC048047 TaxID=3155748 RepID=UPI0034234D02
MSLWMVTDEELAEQRDREAAWLDEVAPRWFHGISRPRLNMNSRTMCVAGQVFGHYCDLGAGWGWMDRVAEQYGFWLDTPDADGVFYGNYSMTLDYLQRMWSEEIERHLTAA